MLNKIKQNGMKNDMIDTMTQFYEIVNKINIDSQEEKLLKIIEKYPVKSTHYYNSLIDWNNPDDPLRKMVIPSSEELIDDGEFDTSGELENTKVKGLQHKYSRTALIICTYQCALYCRYCFRKRFQFMRSQEIAEDYSSIFHYIKGHKEINNILLTGGDPLTLKTEKLISIINRCLEIEHIKFVRIGTKYLTSLPQRIIEDDLLLNYLEKVNRSSGKQLLFITHFNHALEITDVTKKAISQLKERNVRLFNQSVLLKGINDNAHILSRLFNELFNNGITPYYLFQCRPVKNIKHFQVPVNTGISLFEKAKIKCSGLSKAVKYVMSHKSGKIEIIGKKNNKIIFKYNESKNKSQLGMILVAEAKEDACWLDDYQFIDLI
jgi:KamA family protein